MSIASTPANVRRALAGLVAAWVLVGAGALPAAALDNLPPDAVRDSVDATSGEPKIIDVLNNDADPEDDSLTIIGVGAPLHGAAVADPTRGEVVYTSDAGYTGSDSFTYTIEDEVGNSDTATIDVVVHECDPIGDAMDDDGIVVGEEWLRCSSFNAHDVVGDVTPVMNPTGGSQALFTTGTAENARGPNSLEDMTAEHKTAYRGANDVSVLRLDLAIPVGADCLAFDLSFQTEEYPEYVETQFNDGFLAELDSSTWDVQNSTITAPDNFAFDGAANIVSVNSSFFDPDRVVLNPGTEYDGSTPLLDARTPITPGAHSLYLSIFDATDYSYDSGAYVDRLRAFDAAEGKCFRGAHQAPNAANDTLSVDEDAQNSVDVLANDVDMDGDPIEVISNTNGSNGTATCTTTTCTYTPNPNFFGSDSFTYRVSDGTGADTGTVSVTVNPMEDPPSAVDDSLITTEDVPATKNVLLNDIEPDRDPLTITGNTNGTHGSVTCAADSCTYTPSADYSGTDSFTYTISDGKVGTDTATVSVQVNPQNDPPEAIDDSLTTDEDVAGEVTVTANDSDVDGDALTVTGKTNGTRGSVTCSSTSCTYTPNPDFFGSDSFTYTISDGKGGTATGAVNVSVDPVQDAPVANGDSITTSEDTAASTNVLANDVDVDGDPKTITADSDGANGTVSCSGSSCTYTPNSNFNGTDSFTYTISDGRGGTATATVNVTVTAVNDAPDAVADTLTTDEDVAGEVVVTTNDSDIEGDSLVVSAKTNGSNGSVSCSGGSCTYTPNADFHGLDFFTYTVSDGNGGTDTATVNVTVTSVNDDPQATDDTTTVTKDTPKDVDVLANDEDVDGDSLAIMTKTDGANGSVTCSTTSCTYTPHTNYLGVDSFTYTVTDGNGGTDIASVSVTVRAPNVPPVAAASPSTDIQRTEGESVAFDGGGSTDSDGQITSYEWSVGDGRSFTGATPTISFGDNGIYDVTLEVCDNDDACDDVSVQVSVANADPTASISSQPSAPLRIDTNKSPSSQPGASAPFTATASDAGGASDPLAYVWDFGDGTTAGSGSSTTHPYKKLGTFTAHVTVTDDDGGTASAQSQPVTVMATGKCGKLQKSYWGKPGAKATVYARTQFWYSKGRTQKPIRGKYINPGQVVKLEPKPGSRTNFQYECIKKKRYLRVEKVTTSLPTLKYEYLPESALVKL